MSRLISIDRDAFRTKLYQMGCVDKFGRVLIYITDLNIALERSTVDAVEVVRCEDCKFNYANQIPSKNVCQLCVELPISDEFYCAYGERKEDGEID